MSLYGSNHYISREEREIKKRKKTFRRKIKPTGYIYHPGSQFCEAEGHLKLRLCLYEYIINSALRDGNYINNN